MILKRLMILKALMIEEGLNRSIYRVFKSNEVRDVSLQYITNALSQYCI